MASLHISISAEPIAYIGNFPVSNSIFTSLIASAILITLAITANKSIKFTKRPQGLQNILEMLVEGFHGLVHDITHSVKTTAFIFPITFTFFLFILLNNWLGLLPGVGTIGVTHHPEPSATNTSLAQPAIAVEHTDAIELGDDHAEDDNEDHAVAATDHAGEDANGDNGHESVFIPILRAGSADLNTTIALALFSMISVQVIGVQALGLSYFSKFFNFKNAIFTFVGLLELVSEFAKIISFAFRLFGNIFAGEVLLVVIAWLLPAIAPIPFLFLEIMVGVIQALVFAMLSIVFMTMATHSHAEEH